MLTQIETEHRTKTNHRIHRLLGQLEALERSIQVDVPCEDAVLQARTIEKGVSSLITYIVAGYLEFRAKRLLQEEFDDTVQQITRIVQLLNR